MLSPWVSQANLYQRKVFVLVHQDAAEAKDLNGMEDLPHIKETKFDEWQRWSGGRAIGLVT